MHHPHLSTKPNKHNWWLLGLAGLIVLGLWLWAKPASTQNTREIEVGISQYDKARVLEIVTATPTANLYGETVEQYWDQEISVEFVSGLDRGATQTLWATNMSANNLLAPKDIIVVEMIPRVDGSRLYLFYDHYRLPALAWVLGLFLLLTLLLAGWHGLGSLIGLVFSIAVIGLFIVPQIIAGQNPILISIIGAGGIALISMYLSHGINRRTTIAVVGTVATIILAIGLSYLFVIIARLTGMGSEEAFALSIGTFDNLDLRGILLGGIVIGTLGVLDDITTAQSAAVEEIAKANPKLDSKELYIRGFSVGREHIVSLVNTLALAYVGASLPLILLFFINARPAWTLINSSLISEEIIRTLVGSIALILAVPITTWLAARYFDARPK